MKKIKTLLIQFNTILHSNEIPLFRGAVIHAVENQENTLFHNHQENKLIYHYPLIQYKTLNRQAAIICLEEGVIEIGKLFSCGDFKFQIGNRRVAMEIVSVKPGPFLVQVWDEDIRYTLRDWLPLSQENYATFFQIEGLAEKIAFLEKILVGNLLSFGKGMNLFFEKEIYCKILQLKMFKPICYKGIKWISFSLIFSCNVSLPNYIGIGKGASIGFGVVKKIGNKN